jgi:translation initiation factor 2 beta subunit (eIF-2beta)/eIF-5
MKPTYDKSFDLWMTREDGLVVYDIIKNVPQLKSISKDLKEKLRGYYEYTVKCSDCGQPIDCSSKKNHSPLLLEKIKQSSNLICSLCMSDYK